MAEPMTPDQQIEWAAQLFQRLEYTLSLHAAYARAVARCMESNWDETPIDERESMLARHGQRGPHNCPVRPDEASRS